MITTGQIANEIAKGTFRPHTALTNMAVSYYQDDANHFARAIFPVLPVRQSSDNYYIFRKEDLLRDSWQRKPAYGHVAPAPLSEETGTYNCKVDQMIMGIDQIRQTDLNRRQGPAIMNPDQQRTRTIAQQANIHQDRLFVQGFFKKGVWGTDLTGVDSTTPKSGQFIKFSNGNSSPIEFIDAKKQEVAEKTGRTPNRLALGANVYKALKGHAEILERVKYGGSTANPASVSLNVLAQLFEVDRVVTMNSIMNKANFGAEADMGYIADPDAFLLAYATDAPAIEEPSAGYIITWDMLGDGQILPITKTPGLAPDHAEYIEGLMATDQRQVAPDLAMFFSEAV